ncbi:hypothetical protein O4H26_05450 [Aequorivita viscosa]|nr:hypothetical protein [Aequorivita viscosa]
MKFLSAIVCLVCFTLPSISYTQISVNDLIEDVKKERGNATDTGKEASDASAMEGMMEGLIESGNIVSDEPLEVRCLTVLHSHHMKLLVKPRNG